MKHVVQFSGGAGSWATARRVADEHGSADLILLTADTNTEAEDWRAFVDACHQDVGGELVILDNGGRDIWDVFEEARFIGNTRVDVCSRVLKREPLRRWLEANCDPADSVIYLGFDWTEEHRLERARPHWAPWTIDAPLTRPPYTEKPTLLRELAARGIPVPSLYADGFPHNNCGGGCVKAGQASWRRLLLTRPEVYAYHEGREERLRELLGKDVAVLRDREGGEDTRPMTLRAFRERLQVQASLFDSEDWGACSCMDNPGEVAVALGGGEL